jgi:hypothetical protein
MTFAAATLVAVLAAGSAMAQPGGTPPTPEQREARFVAADANKDGKLDKAEFVSSLPERAQAMADQIWSSRVDADGDGFVTREQFLALRMGPAGGGGQDDGLQQAGDAERWTWRRHQAQADAPVQGRWQTRGGSSSSGAMRH